MGCLFCVGAYYPDFMAWRSFATKRPFNMRKCELVWTLWRYAARIASCRSIDVSCQMQWLNVATWMQSKWIVKGFCDAVQPWSDFYLQGLSSFCRCEASKTWTSSNKWKMKLLQRGDCVKICSASDVPLPPRIHGGSYTINTAATNTADWSFKITIHLLNSMKYFSSKSTQDFLVTALFESSNTSYFILNSIFSYR